MPTPLRESGRTPPMTAPIAARPELPKNLRRLVLNLLPAAALPPGSRAMVSAPLLPASGLSWPASLRESRLGGVFAFCARAARWPEGAVDEEKPQPVLLAYPAPGNGGAAVEHTVTKPSIPVRFS